VAGTEQRDARGGRRGWGTMRSRGRVRGCRGIARVCHLAEGQVKGSAMGLAMVLGRAWEGLGWAKGLVMVPV
jgi:hypothetical protein